MKYLSIAAAISLALSCSSPAMAQGSGVKVGMSKNQPFGAYLTGSNGRALYMFEADKPGTSNCYAQCAQAWPPLDTKGKPEADSGVNSAMLATTKRHGGALQVTYNNMPLYYFSRDQGPGTTAGEGIKGFGGEWYLVSPEGKKLEKDEDH